MTTRIPSRHTILAAAILALLAGCGSGQDDSATRTKATANSLVTAASSSAQTTDGALAPSLGTLMGTGTGRGAALLVVLAGVVTTGLHRHAQHQQ